MEVSLENKVKNTSKSERKSSAELLPEMREKWIGKERNEARSISAYIKAKEWHFVSSNVD